MNSGGYEFMYVNNEFKCMDSEIIYEFIKI